MLNLNDIQICVQKNTYKLILFRELNGDKGGIAQIMLSEGGVGGLENNQITSWGLFVCFTDQYTKQLGALGFSNLSNKLCLIKKFLNTT